MGDWKITNYSTDPLSNHVVVTVRHGDTGKLRDVAVWGSSEDEVRREVGNAIENGDFLEDEDDDEEDEEDK